MKIYISADLEGVNGVVYSFQTDKSGSEEYAKSKKQQLHELNTIINTLKENNIKKITLNDAHGSMNNIDHSCIDEDTELITGKPRTISMLYGLDSSYDCVFLTGCHAKANNKGVLAHSVSDIFSYLKINGKEIGEIELNCLYASSKNVPVVFITGDDKACEEASNLKANIKTVITKKYISRNSAICKSKIELDEDLKNKTNKTIKEANKWSTLDIPDFFELEIQFKKIEHADLCKLLPGIEELSAHNIIYKSTNYADIYKLIQYFAATLK